MISEPTEGCPACQQLQIMGYRFASSIISWRHSMGLKKKNRLNDKMVSFPPQISF